jgi:endogenous inhibitor of DNA gyrase (YacG/DUF329 family)
MNSTTFKCINCGKEHPWRRQSTNKYCSITCQKEYEYKQRVQDWLDNKTDWGKNKVPEWPKRYLLESRGSGCEICGITEHNSKPIVLECDHIDGDHLNNRPENLRMICPNCHSQTSTYKAKNKGNGRKR